MPQLTVYFVLVLSLEILKSNIAFFEKSLICSYGLTSCFNDINIVHFLPTVDSSMPLRVNFNSFLFSRIQLILRKESKNKYILII